MRAIVCTSLGSPGTLEIQDLPEPVPGPGEVQVRLAAWGVNYVDALMVAGLYQHRPDPPFIPGLEAAGTVTALGDGVTGLKVGDRVMTSHRPGAFAEVVTLPASGVFALPDSMDFVAAAAFRSAYQTAYHALVQRGRVQKDDVVLIHGASGGVGLAAVHIARMLGGFVVATGASAEKMAVVRKQGAHHTIVVPPGGSFRDEVKMLTSGRGVDVVYDPVGGDLFDESMRCLTWGARLLVIGFTSGRAAAARTNQLLIKGASVIGIRAGEIGRQVPGTTERNMAILLGCVADGKLVPHVSHRFAFSQAAEALRAVTDRKVVGKAVLLPD